MPFVSRRSRACCNRDEVDGIVAGLRRVEQAQGFELFREIHHGGSSTIVVVLPRRSIHPVPGLFRGDIVWMWKALCRRRAEKVRCGREGALVMLHTTDPRRYVPTTDPEIGSFDEPALLWAWIEYVLSLPKRRQNRAIERRRISGCRTVQSALKTLRSWGF